MSIIRVKLEKLKGDNVDSELVVNLRKGASCKLHSPNVKSTSRYLLEVPELSHVQYKLLCEIQYCTNWFNLNF
jgi:hypothetical protein